MVDIPLFQPNHLTVCKQKMKKEFLGYIEILETIQLWAKNELRLV